MDLKEITEQDVAINFLFVSFYLRSLSCDYELILSSFNDAVEVHLYQ